MSEVIQLIPAIRDGETADDFVARLSTPQLKHLWLNKAGEVICDEIYFEMQRRGEGKFVAV